MSKIAMLNGLGKSPRRHRRRRRAHHSYAYHGMPMASLGAEGGADNTMMWVVVGALAIGAFMLLRKKDDEADGGGYVAPSTGYQSGGSAAAQWTGPQARNY